ncbi:hypothetical protein AB0R11_23500, partial [Streptomyces fradiae]
MPQLSPRLAEAVAALPLAPHLRVLEIGCGPERLRPLVAAPDAAEAAAGADCGPDPGYRLRLL